MSAFLRPHYESNALQMQNFLLPSAHRCIEMLCFGIVMHVESRRAARVVHA